MTLLSSDACRRLRAGLALGCLVLGGGGAYGAESKGGQDAALREVLRKAQGVLRQLSEEKAALEADKATLQGEKSALETKVKTLEDALRKLEPFPAQVEQCKTSLEALQSTKTTLESQLSQGRDKERGLLRKQQEIVAQARDIQGDNELLVEAVKEREQWIGQCGQRNKTLMDANRELLEKYKDKGLWDRLTDLEPLTGFGKVATENAAEEYRYKLHQLKATPFQPEAPAPERPPAAEPTANPNPAEAGAGATP